MDELDSKLKDIIVQKIETPEKYKQTIRNSLYENKKNAKFNILKIAATFILTLGVTLGVVYAGFTTYQKVYDKIWVEPYKKSAPLDGIPQYSTEITEEDIKKVESEEEAVELAKEIIKDMGYGEPEIYSVQLKKNYTIACELAYVIKTKKGIERGLEICINAENGKCVGFNDRDLKYETVNADKLNEEQVLEIAKDIYLKLGLKAGEYELKELKESSHYFQNKGKDMWDITFAKKYDGTFNYFERVSMSFAVINGKVRTEQAYYCNEYNFEDHPIVISEEEAIKIAKEKDRKITSNEVKTTELEMQIRLMNTFIYVQEMSGGKENGLVTKVNEKGEEETYLGYQAPYILRKVWAVTIEYIRPEENEDYLEQYVAREYLIDVTTGEVIGGSGFTAGWHQRKIDMES